MLCRVSCKACRIFCLWTDDPRGFLKSVCLHYRDCRAKLIDEGFGERVAVRRARSISPRRASTANAATERRQERRPILSH